MNRHQVTCVRKDPRTHAITHIGVPGLGGYTVVWEAKKAIDEIKGNVARYFVRLPTGHEVEVRVAGEWPNEYLHSAADNTPMNNLVNLPPCT